MQWPARSSATCTAPPSSAACCAPTGGDTFAGIDKAGDIVSDSYEAGAWLRLEIGDTAIVTAADLASDTIALVEVSAVRDRAIGGGL